MGRLLTLAGVAVSLAGFIAGETGSTGWWPVALSRGGYVLVGLSVVAALLSRRTANILALGALVLAAAAALAFTTVAISKYYTTSSSFGAGLSAAFTWLGEAQLFGIAALAFGLTLARRRNAAAMAGLGAAAALAVGCGIYAITLQGNFAAYMWWLVAAIGAFLAASAAALLERAGGFAIDAPVAVDSGSYEQAGDSGGE